MEKIVRIGSQPEYSSYGSQQVPSDIFCKIEYIDRKLSITGVIGATPNGNALGSCGQIYDNITPNSFAKGWSKLKLTQFIEIWEEWHLNDMNACSLEMKAAQWGKLASKEIFKYSCIRTDERHKEFERLENRIKAAALNDELYLLNDEEKRLLTSKRFKDIYAYELPEPPEFMQIWEDYQTKKPKIKRNTLGWTNNSEHPDGLLERKLNPNDEYGYGQKWFFHEVPSEVIEFLQALPDADKQPVWI